MPFPRPERPQDAAERPEQPFPSRSRDGATRVPRIPLRKRPFDQCPAPVALVLPAGFLQHRIEPRLVVTQALAKSVESAEIALSISMPDGLIDQVADRDESGPIVVATQLAGECAELKKGGRLAGAVADGLPDLKRPRELLPRRRVVALLDVDRGELVPGGRLAGAVADGLLDLKRPRELLPRRRVVALAEVDRGELVPGGRLAGAVADGLLDLKRPRELLPRRRVGALVEVDRGELCQVAASPARSPMAC